MEDKKQMIEIEQTNDENYIKNREKRMKTERLRLKRIIKAVDSERKKIAEPMIEELAFMRIKCEDLREHILKHGVVEEYQNGAHQWGKKKSSEFEVYNQLIKNYIPLSKQFIELLPKVVAEEVSDGFDEFVGSKPAR